MKFKISSELEYQILSDSTLILNIHALRTPSQTVLEESFIVDPFLKGEELLSSHGENRFMRVEAPTGTHLKIKYDAVVDNAIKLINSSSLNDVPVSELDSNVLTYLNPSRYCQSDKLYRLANNKFGTIGNAFEKVIALTEWIHRNVEYLSGSTNSQTSAYDTVTEQAGVCRDFAHLGIALCRALTIPARYFTGYAFSLEPPDFHACFEAYLGGHWIIFDATKLSPLNGLIKIASGRDAADAAIASLFGNVFCQTVKVSSQCLENNFIPFYYIPSQTLGINYI
jgi:transglutaminase-like putative cysteine protease